MRLSAISLAVWAATITILIIRFHRNDPQSKKRPGLWPATWVAIVGIPVSIIALGGLL